MWHCIEKQLAEHFQTTVTLTTKKMLPGADTHRAYCVHDDANNRDYFIKINDISCFEMFDCEAIALTQLAHTQIVNVPQVILVERTVQFAYIALEYIPLISSPSNKQWFQLGQQLALLHQNQVNPDCGWQQDNFIGLTAQPNKWQHSWRLFFAEQRIGWQLQLLAEKGIMLGNIDFIIDRCKNLLGNHKPIPCLLHGDLWRGNVGFTQNNAYVFDPACYYGDRETDLAMTELFGAFPAAFYQGYNAIYPVDHHYEQRKPIYQLYHLLNHANIFGHDYVIQAKALINRIIAQQTA
jgi:fructosamine-3-kinase